MAVQIFSWSSSHVTMQVTVCRAIQSKHNHSINVPSIPLGTCAPPSTPTLEKKYEEFFSLLLICLLAAISAGKMTGAPYYGLDGCLCGGTFQVSARMSLPTDS